MTNPGPDAGQAVAIEQVAEAIALARPRLDTTGRRIADPAAAARQFDAG